jgi:hypothetical protein
MFIRFCILRKRLKFTLQNYETNGCFLTTATAAAAAAAAHIILCQCSRG